MNFNEYQKQAMTTATYPREHAVEYPAALLVEEVGELMKCFTKPMRDGGEVDRERAADELGDCLWALAALASDYKVTLSESMTTNCMTAFSRHALQWWPADRTNNPGFLSQYSRRLAMSAAAFYNAMGRQELLGDTRRDNLAMAVMQDICALAYSIDYTLETVAQRNLDKLADRAARGVIGGEGDER